MGVPSRTTVAVERLTFGSQREFTDVVERIYQGIGRPDFAKVMDGLAGAATFDDYRRIIEDAAGPSGLLRMSATTRSPAWLRLMISHGGAVVHQSRHERYRLSIHPCHPGHDDDHVD